MIYKAKVDWWIGTSLAAAISVLLALSIFGHHPWIPRVLTAFLLVLIFGCGYPQSYRTAKEGLIVRAGLIRRTIPYPEITGVNSYSDGQRTLTLSVALTRDIVFVEYAGGAGLLIGPQNQEAFFDDMARRCPQLSRRGLGLAVSIL